MAQIIDNNTIRQYLNTKNIDTTDTTDTEISNIYNTYLNYILTLTGINLNPTTITHTNLTETQLQQPYYILPDAPITEIQELNIDNNLINPSSYYADLDNGIIRWKTQPTGNLITITYTKETDPETIQLIGATILDLITYTLDTNPNKDIKTLKEGDISITYDTDNNTTSRIYNNLETLKNIENTIPKSHMIR